MRPKGGRSTECVSLRLFPARALDWFRQQPRNQNILRGKILAGRILNVLRRERLGALWQFQNSGESQFVFAVESQVAQPKVVFLQSLFEVAQESLAHFLQVVRIRAVGLQ